MIEIRNITKRYGRMTAVDGLSVTIGDDCIYGFLGPNGAGKTTTLNIMTGCLAANEGTVVINGHDIYDDPIAARRCVGYLPEQPPLYPEMTPREYLAFVAEAKGVAAEHRDTAVERVMRRTAIEGVADRLIKQLSKGYRQRVGVAQAILGDPDIVVLDEPTVGLDPIQVMEMRELIRSLGENHTVIFSSHILSEVSLLCGRVLIISGGRVAAEDTPENLSKMLKAPSLLKVTAKGGAAVLEDILGGIDGVRSIKAGATDGRGYTELTIEGGEGDDLREAVSQRLMGAGCAILSMNLEAASLEEVFMQFTKSGEGDTAGEDVEKEDGE